MTTETELTDAELVRTAIADGARLLADRFSSEPFYYSDDDTDYTRCAGFLLNALLDAYAADDRDAACTRLIWELNEGHDDDHDDLYEDLAVAANGALAPAPLLRFLTHD